MENMKTQGGEAPCHKHWPSAAEPVPGTTLPGSRLQRTRRMNSAVRPGSTAAAGEAWSRAVLGESFGFRLGAVVVILT